MKRMLLPAVLLKKSGDRMRAVMGWRLTSILSAQLATSLLGGKELHADGPEQQLRRFAWNRESLLRAVARWPLSASLELDFRFHPNLAAPAGGKAEVHVFLWVYESTSTSAKEVIHALSFQLQALLGAAFVEADFAPITSASELGDALSCFEPASAMTLERKRFTALSLKDDLKPMGFVHPVSRPDSEAVEGAAPVELAARWRGNQYAMDQLFAYAMGLPSMSWFKVRVAPADGLDTERRELMSEVERYASAAQHAGPGMAAWLDSVRQHSMQRMVDLERERLRIGVCALFANAPDPSLLAFLESAVVGDTAESSPMGGGAMVQKSVSPSQALRGNHFSDARSCSIAEAAQAFRLPLPPVGLLPGVPVKGFRSQFAPVQLLGQRQGATPLGRNEHRGQVQEVSLSLEDRFRHLYCIGMTGTGKSTFLEGLLLSDMEAGHGVCLVDPHGELIQSILGKIPAHRVQDVILFDPLDTERPVGFNILEWQTLLERDHIVDSLYVALDSMYDMLQTGGPIFEAHYRNMLKLLMGDRPDPETFTILEFQHLYNDKNFRNFLKSRTEEFEVRQFLEEAMATGGDADFKNVRPYITSKFNRFTSDGILKNIFGQTHTQFSFDDVVNNGKILLINLAKGRLGQAVGTLLASQIIGRIKVAALSRSSMPESHRKPFFLYVDEFQNVVGDDFSEMLAEARKYRLGLVMANQYVKQLQPKREKQSNVIQAILGNVGTFVLFQVGPEDARQLEPMLLPHLSQHDLMSLPARKAYVRLRSDPATSWPFIIDTVKTTLVDDPARRRGIIERSCVLFGRDRKQVEAEILERRQRKWEEYVRPCMDFEKAL